MKNKISPLEHSESLIKKLPPLAKLKSDDELYGFNGKFYEILTFQELGKFFYDYILAEGLATTWSPMLEKSVIKALSYHPGIEIVDNFNSNNNYINAENGIVDLSTPFPYKLLPHSQKEFFTYVVDVKYRPKKLEAPTFMGFLETSLTDHEMKPNREVIKSILMVCGYCLYPKQRLEGIFLFLGDGSNGKSLLIEILASFFPSKFVTSLSLREMSRESMDREVLIYSMLNISGEEKGTPIDPSQMKKIASGQPISIKRKFKQPVEVISPTKIIADSNSVINFSDTSHGLERRLNIFNWENKVVSQGEYDNSFDPIKERLVVRKHRSTFFPEIMKEKSAIFNIFLKHLNKLRNRNWKLPVTTSGGKTFEQYRRDTDTFGAWINENYQRDITAEPEGISVLQVMNDFKGYYDENFPGTQFKYSTKGIGRRIKQIFRIEGEKKNVKTLNGGRSTATVYPLIEKMDF